MIKRVREGCDENLHMLDIGYAFALVENRKVFICTRTRILYYYNNM